ncbi:hypothetical protein LPTSP4_01710 [Leptospira ryugenii]|uniref:Uncharacterized protein n=1 Tax=Leptospira ryugenii TaxID=1917863 RepID=A0A2P2DVK6_9LEPT|nr:hypothetical protein [Leptospira ryugenii]GBF48671.1 hypothetical protein LPTSP4_01710 [Leptospira ryugenii]
MNERNKWIWGGLAVIAVGLFAYLLFDANSEKNGQKFSSKQWEKDSSDSISANSLFDEPEFSDAPRPDDDELGQAETLWPFALEKKPNRKEQVKEEWREFAAKYPNNFYIPREMRPSLTAEQEKENQVLLEDFTAVDASIAAELSRGKWSEPGSNPSAEPSSRPTASKQKAYFDFKIHELESRIQMIEYWMEKQPSLGAEKATAERDLKLWRQELSSLQEVRNSVPKT